MNIVGTSSGEFTPTLGTRVGLLQCQQQTLCCHFKGKGLVCAQGAWFAALSVAAALLVRSEPETHRPTAAVQGEPVDILAKTSSFNF